MMSADGVHVEHKGLKARLNCFCAVSCFRMIILREGKGFMKNLIMTAPMKGLLFGMSVLLLQACGGSGGGGDVSDSGGLSFSGNSAPAEISSENAQEIGETAGESIQQAAAASGSPVSTPLGIELDSENQNVEIPAALMDLHEEVIASSGALSGLPIGPTVNVSEVCDSGSATATVPNFGGNTPSGRVVITIRYSNCTSRTEAGSISINGTVRFEYADFGNPNGATTIVYRNVRVSIPGVGTQTLNYTYTCSNPSDPRTCGYISDFQGSDGNTHRISDFSVSGNGQSGYTGAATFKHYTYGEVTISFNGITYGSCGSQPDGGSITFSSSNLTRGTINFNSNCTVSGTWTTSTGSGSF